MEFTAYILDDQPLYVDIIKKIIVNNFPNVKIVGASLNVEDIDIKINEACPDILFLDINVGQFEIFDFLPKITVNPQIIFVSSESKYALNAFRFDAVDFILKPISKDICIAAISKAIKNLNARNIYLPKAQQHNEWKRNYISVSYMDRVEIINIENLVCCSAEGRCTRFRLKDGRELVSSKNLAEYGQFFEMHPSFLRVSRSSVVNFKYINKVVKKDGMHCVFTDGHTVPVARRKYNDLHKFLNNLISPN